MIPVFSYLNHSLSNLFVFEGRASRMELFVFLTTQQIVFLIIGALSGISMNYPIAENLKSISIIGPFIAMVVSVVLPLALLTLAVLIIAANVSIYIRRLHDINYSGYWYFPLLLLNTGFSFYVIPWIVEKTNLASMLNDTLASILTFGLTIPVIYLIWFQPPSKGKNDYGSKPSYQK